MVFVLRNGAKAMGEHIIDSLIIALESRIGPHFLYSLLQTFVGASARIGLDIIFENWKTKLLKLQINLSPPYSGLS